MQLIILDQIEKYSTRFLDQPADSRSKIQYLIKTIKNQLNKICLTFSIALLDYFFKENLFENTVIEFLAIFGINTDYSNFRNPNYYTIYLSVLVKIAQILIVEQTIEIADYSKISYPADILDKIYEYFLLYSVRTLFG